MYVVCAHLSHCYGLYHRYIILLYIGGTHVHVQRTSTCKMSCSERFALLCLCSHARLPRQSPLGCRQPATPRLLPDPALPPTHTPSHCLHSSLLPSHYPPHPSLVLLFFYSLLATPTLLHWYMVLFKLVIFFFSPLFSPHMHAHIPFLAHIVQVCIYIVPVYICDRV